MMPIAFYLLKMFICSGLLLLYYRVALRDKQFHYYNRFYLLFTAVASLLLPMLQLHWFSWNSADDKANALLTIMYAGNNLNNIKVPAEQGINWPLAICMACGACTVLLLGILLWRIQKINRLKQQYPSSKMGDFRLINTDLPQAPFSFLHNLFWRTDIPLDTETGRQILRHELTHIRQKHTWDKLFMQVLTAFCWMNPFYWLLQKELYLIHEFIADEKAIEHQDGAAFAAMLLSQQFNGQVFAPAQSFSYSPIKRRLFMITSSQQPRYNYARRLLVLPLAACIVMLFAFKIVPAQSKKKDGSNMQYKGKVFSQCSIDATKETVTLHFTDGSTKIISLDEAVKENIVGRIFSKDSSVTIPLTAHDDTLSLTGSLTTTNKSVFGESGSGLKQQPIYIIDGKEISTDEMKKINPSTIESINILKGSSAKKKYGAKGKNGVVEITLKEPNPSESSQSKNLTTGSETTSGDSAEYQQKQKQAQTTIIVNQPVANSAQPKPMYVVNGTITTKDIQNIDPASIFSLVVLKDKHATDKYGTKGKNGVVEITTTSKK